MIYKRSLKNVAFEYNSETKNFKVQRLDSIQNAMNVVLLNKSEACAYSRFIFSMVQYYSHAKKKKVLKVAEPFEGSGDKVSKV